jgi:hypothetical protein
MRVNRRPRLFIRSRWFSSQVSNSHGAGDAQTIHRTIEAFLEQGISAYAGFRRCVRSCFDLVDAWPTQHSRVAISSNISLNSFAAADREAAQ